MPRRSRVRTSSPSSNAGELDRPPDSEASDTARCEHWVTAEGVRVATEPFVIDDRETPRFRVNRRALVDPDVLAAERDKIFNRCWLYVGHESEVARPGEFVTRMLGRQPVAGGDPRETGHR